MTPPLTPAEVAALIAELSNQPGDGGVAFVPFELLDRTRAALLALQADARRYRQLEDMITWMPAGWNGCKVARFDLWWQNNEAALGTALDAALAASEKEDEMSERETPMWYLDSAGMTKANGSEAATIYVRKRDADVENARLKEELADATEHATYEQRRAEGAVAELVEVHAKLAEAQHQCIGACFK
jgi:hypothetical protein